MTEQQQLLARIDELEMKQAFQEQTIEELNQALTEQQFLIDKLMLQMKFMVGKVKGMEPNNMARESEETPPPHY
ncbi:SlyX family protein [Photobacterium damselae subsp. piscicida]|uniref:Protein SlyX homolog n=1 Tax=Photobacterium damsela subsp. piscicida TaxID=38294 RepID=A0A7L8A462_PHODP|nr:SlyX family protein [Photobacterium damselae]MDP2515863.1 SlyX family protein [Photobacterium damselae subsp. piscicida]MDP2533604.1 SlyX family protein [Photobacterium damselae subsp. piscicida]MDP2544421.1 SlyX family protein [Photobacterium damselae subsp. piscicida]MDP2557361.1 SlyX family protein [Photobacterium damselae subsp. piscicida]MDP2568705.1 SlyX family protein [Photobacterium damselae subsp. piscicida]